MLTPAGYTIERTLATSQRSEVALAIREADGSHVVLKCYHDSVRAGPEAQIQREFEALHTCAGPGLPRALDLVGEEQTILVMEFVPGVTLDSWASRPLPSPLALVRVAIQICDVLTRIHEARLIHRDLAPANIIVEPTELAIHVIDLGLARPLGSQSHARDCSLSRDGAHAVHSYMAPEQTGRMNRGVDARSDLYSLGATLYRVATGYTPFRATDPLALMHAHMARVPTPAVERRPDLPGPISRILAKLLEKEPAERYQSARALRADLRICQEQLEKHDRIDPELELGMAELPDGPNFGSRLYGRDSEMALIRQLYVEASNGTTRLLLLAGEPGAGKSALVDTLRERLAENDGFLAIGKFDLSQDQPYTGWANALGHLAQQILVESDARLESWRTQISAQIGNLGTVLVELIPDLAFILEETVPVPRVGPRESLARLILAIQRFLSACATREHPLVLFLDDLQWSDAASRTVLEQVIIGAPPEALLLVGAYRANEVDAAHPLMRTLARLNRDSECTEQIALAPLSREATVQMLSTALGRGEEDVAALAREIEHKTSNAPLFVRQFVDHLHGQGLIRFSPGHGWEWDTAEIAALDIHDGAAELMSAKVLELPPRVRDVVELASCVGDEFDRELLVELSRESREDIDQALFALADAGLIGPCPRGFRFLHDRVREAANASLSEDARAQLHADMARLLLQRLSEEEHEGRIFEIAQHQAKGIEHIPESDRVHALRLQLRAGERAIGAGAAVTAETYLRTARQLLRDEDWETLQADVVTLHLRSAESGFLRGDAEPALRHIDALESRPLTLIQRAQAEAHRIQILSLSKDPDEVAEYVFTALQKLGAPWRAYPSPFRFRLDLRLLRLEIALRGAERILRPARDIDPQRIALLILLGQGIGVLGRRTPRLLWMATIWGARQNLRKGFITSPGLSLATLATSFLLRLGDKKLAQSLSSLLQGYLPHEPNPIMRLRIEQHVHSQFLPWQLPRRKALAPLETNAESLREAGDLEFAYYSKFLKLILSALAGDPVQQTEQDFRDQIDEIGRAGHVYPEPGYCHEAYALLSAPDVAELDIDSRLIEAEAELMDCGTSASSFARTTWVMVLSLIGRFDLAFAQSEILLPNVLGTLGLIYVADAMFLRGVSAAALASNLAGGRDARRRYRRALRQARSTLRSWERQRGTPDLAHMILLLDAETLRLSGHLDRARRLYDQSIERADRQGYPHHAALAAERRAVAMRQRNLLIASTVSLKDAIRRYRAWGFEAKARELEGARPSY